MRDYTIWEGYNVITSKQINTYLYIYLYVHFNNSNLSNYQ